MRTASTCAECGATDAFGSCDELFQALLALDHSRRPPWGPLHGAVVACFFLQHPTRVDAAEAQSHFGWALLQAFVDGGLPALAAASATARRRNSHRHRRDSGGASPVLVDGPPLPQRTPPATFATTIADVAVDGSFPAEHYERRVRSWALDTIAAWTDPGR